jgi:hypothetical protein
MPFISERVMDGDVFVEGHLDRMALVLIGASNLTRMTRYTHKIGEVFSYLLSADYSDCTTLVSKRTVCVTNHNNFDRVLKLPTGIMQLLLENLQFQL